MPRNLARNVPLVRNRLTAPELLQLAAHVRGRPHARPVLEQALQARHGIKLPVAPAPGQPIECAQPLIRILHAAMYSPEVPEPARKELRRALDIDPAYTVSEYATTHFTFRYTTDAGSDQVRDPTVDTAAAMTLYNDPATVLGTTVAGNGVPDYVERIALLMEHAHERFVSADFGFTDPSPAARITVTIENTSPYLGWASPDNQISLSRELTEAYLHDTPIHELFHLFQFVYDVDLGSIDGLLYEGTARLIPDTIDDRGNRWMWAAYANYAASPNTPLDHLSYDAAAFWKYATEQLTAQATPADEPFFGVDVIRRAWELAESTAATGMTGLATVIEHVTPPQVRFASFAESRLGLVSNETVFGNWLLANVCKDLAAPVPDARFDYVEDEDAPGMAIVTKTSVGSLAALPASIDVNDWAARYLEIDLSGLTGGLELGLTATRTDGLAGAPDGLAQIVLVDSAGAIMDIIKTSAASYRRHLGLPYGTGADARAPARMLLVLAGRGNAVRFAPTLTQVAAAPDLMITRWNSEGGREYQRNWHDGTFDYRSPDMKLEPARLIRPWEMGRDPLHVSVRVRNKGAAAAHGVRVGLKLQLSPRVPFPPRPLEWTPVVGPPVSASFDVPANGDKVVTIDVPSALPRPLPALSRMQWLTVQARILGGGDGSPDNNEAMSRFSLR